VKITATAPDRSLSDERPWAGRRPTAAIPCFIGRFHRCYVEFLRRRRRRQSPASQRQRYTAGSVCAAATRSNLILGHSEPDVGRRRLTAPLLPGQTASDRPRLASCLYNRARYCVLWLADFVETTEKRLEVAVQCYWICVAATTSRRYTCLFVENVTCCQTYNTDKASLITFILQKKNFSVFNLQLNPKS